MKNLMINKSRLLQTVLKIALIVFICLILNICVLHANSTTIETKHFVIYVNRTPVTYTIGDLARALEYSYSWYIRHGLKIASPCEGSKITVIVTNLSSYWGLTWGDPERRCVIAIAINYDIGDNVSGVFYLNKTVAHELFHVVELAYIRYSDVWSDPEYEWILESSAVAMSYLVYPIWEYLDRYPSPLKCFTEEFFKGKYYLHDPAEAGFIGGDAPYVYAPLFYIIFKKALRWNSLNKTIEEIFGSYDPNSGLWLYDLSDAYAELANGFPLEPNLRPYYVSFNGSITLTVEPRTAVYLTYIGTSGEKWAVLELINTSKWINPDSIVFSIYEYHTKYDYTYSAYLDVAFVGGPYNLYVADEPTNMSSGNVIVLTTYGWDLPPGMGITVKFEFRNVARSHEYFAYIEPHTVDLSVGKNSTLRVRIKPCYGIVAMYVKMLLYNASWYWDNEISTIKVEFDTPPSSETNWQTWWYSGWSSSNNVIESEVGLVLSGPSTLDRCTITLILVNGTSAGKAMIKLLKVDVLDEAGNAFSIVRSNLGNATIRVGNMTVRTFHMFIVPSRTSLLVNSTRILNIVVLPGYDIAGATMTVVVDNVTVAEVVNYTKGDLGGNNLVLLKCHKYGICTLGHCKQVLRCAVASARSCNKENCTLIRLIIRGNAEGITIVRVLNGTVSDVEGNVYNVTKLGYAIVRVYTYPMCDLNKNGRLDIGDAVLCLRAVVGEYKPDVPCDLNRNGRQCDIGDCVLILRRLIGG